MYPPAPGVAKRAHKGMKLAGYTIPEETEMLVRERTLGGRLC